MGTNETTPAEGPLVGAADSQLPEPAGNRSVILSRALELWGARGYDAVGVAEIVEAAGITKPTMYHYFGSKRGLLDALVEDRSAPLRVALETAADYRHDLTATLEAIVRAYFDFARSNATFYRLLMAAWFAPEGSDEYAAIREGSLAQHAALERLFEQAAGDHGNMRGRARPYAATFLGTINTYVGLALNGYAELDERLVYTATHQFQHGIYS